MKTGIVAGGIAVVLAAVGGGYLLGTRHAAPDATAQATAPAASAPKAERKLLYYRNPMGQPDTSPVPKKDSMGMDYIPVYEDEAPTKASGNEIKISADRVQKLGVRTQLAQLRALDRVVRASGRVDVDERRLATIAPKFEGYVEKLYVNATGQVVTKGQPIFDAYSPELVSAQREYAIAMRGVQALREAGGTEGQPGMAQLAESSLTRLRNWDVPEEQIAALAKTGEAKRTVTFRSPVSGIVMERKAVSGMRFMPGEALYQVADLSSLWVLADVNEQDIGLVANGARATVSMNAYPDKRFQGIVTYVYPTLKAETRTVQVRIELANPGGLLKPGMYAQVELGAGNAGKVVAVPASAVIDSGVRRVVIVQLGEGRFESRQVETGARGDDWVEIRFGLKEGEPVVVAANFLIDSESNLRAALGGLAGDKGTEARSGAPHQAHGKLDALDASTGRVTITHEPVASLRWPTMTMDFVLANPAVGTGVKPGAVIDFEFVERKPGEWVITAITPAAAAKGH
jgi:Cu(I)/Ag(I) efflux system membrane fusion protein